MEKDDRPKDYRLSLKLCAQRVFDMPSPAEQRLLRQMMADDPVHTPEESRAADKLWFERLRAKANQKN